MERKHFIFSSIIRKIPSLFYKIPKIQISICCEILNDISQRYISRRPQMTQYFVISYHFDILSNIIVPADSKYLFD